MSYDAKSVMQSIYSAIRLNFYFFFLETDPRETFQKSYLNINLNAILCLNYLSFYNVTDFKISEIMLRYFARQVSKKRELCEPFR